MLFKATPKVRDSFLFCKSLVGHICDQVNCHEIFSFFMDLDQGLHFVFICRVFPNKAYARGSVPIWLQMIIDSSIPCPNVHGLAVIEDGTEPRSKS